MLDVLKSSVHYLLSLVLKLSPIKFVSMTVIFVVMELLLVAVWELLPDWFNLNGVFSGLTPGVWFFLDLFAINTGVPLILGAYGTRFLIRRLPLVG